MDGFKTIQYNKLILRTPQISKSTHPCLLFSKKISPMFKRRTPRMKTKKM